MGKRSLRKGNTDFLNGLREQTFCKIESKILTTKCVVMFQVHAEFASFDTSTQILRQGSDYSYLVSTAKSDFSEFYTCFHTDSQVKRLRFNIRVFFAALPKRSNIKLDFLEFNVHVVFVLPTKKTVVCTSDIYDQIIFEETDSPSSKVILLLLLT